MNIRLKYKEIVRQYVSPYKRQPNRLKWLTALVDLQGVFDSFALWRANYRYLFQISSQHKTLEGHLRKLFDANIIVRSYSDKYLEIGLTSEPAHWQTFDREIALEGEAQQEFGDVDFIVYAPASVEWNLLYAEIEKYKLADRTYKIIMK